VKQEKPKTAHQPEAKHSGYVLPTMTEFDVTCKGRDLSCVKVGAPFIFLRFEVFTAVTMKNGVFWDVTPCGSCKNRRFGRT
jgi:hypothetical protein